MDELENAAEALLGASERLGLRAFELEAKAALEAVRHRVSQ